jgi:hypothetical protein
MQGFERMDRQLADVGALAGHLVPTGSMFAFLAEHRGALFPDEEYADLFAPAGKGRRAVIRDPEPAPAPYPRKQLIKRLRKRECELCETGTTVSVHQVTGLKELGKPGPGQPAWAALLLLDEPPPADQHGRASRCDSGLPPSAMRP